MGRRPRRRGAPARSAWTHRAPVDGRARGVPGPPDGEDDLPRARHPRVPVRRGRRSRRAARRGRRDRAPRGAEDPSGRLRRQGPGGAARARRRRARVRGAGGRRAVDPRGLRAVRPRGVRARGAQARRSHPRLAAGREPPRGRDPAGVDRTGDRRGGRAPGRRQRLRDEAARALRVRGGHRGRAVRGRRHARRERDGTARAQLGALDDRGRGHEPVRESSPRGARLADRLGPGRRRRARW